MNLHSTLAMLLLLVACNEYGLKDQETESPSPPVDSARDWDSATISPEETGDSGTPPEPEEECNGQDDDGDGLVDEGFEDVDGDGIADCVDDDCDLQRLPDGEVEVHEECSGSVEPVLDPWDVVIEWRYYVTDGKGPIVMPAVGNLTDDNGDGRVDEHDTPDVAFSSLYGSTLTALHGDGRGEIFSVPGVYGRAGVSIADVDQDGRPEVICFGDDGTVKAMDGAGNERWSSSPVVISDYPQPTVADLDGDGDVEVIMDRVVLSGADGSIQFMLDEPAADWRTPVVADLDQDGTLEIILGESVFAHDGSLEWESSLSYYGSFAAVADVDGDPEGEVFFVEDSWLHLHEADGSLIRSVMLPGDLAGPPSVADFDGDGQVEIAVPSGSRISVLETSGALLWSSPISDISGLAGCSGYDVDGDGSYEVIYADEATLYIFDGATGVQRYSNNYHSSGTQWEYPVIADVDADGSAEIVLSSNWGGFQSLTVFGHNGSGWAASGPTWGIHDFAVTNLQPDGTVPTPPIPPWSTHNVFRARPAQDDPCHADLTIWLVDWCVASCQEGLAKVSFGVANYGGADVEAGTSVALYRVDAGVQALLATTTLDAVPSGQALDGGIFVFSSDQWGEEGLLLRVDDYGDGTGGLAELDEGNNEQAFEEGICGN